MGSKNKLKRFKDNESFENVIQPSREEVIDGFSLKGKWHSFFKNDNPIVLELGCGKGEYSVSLAEKLHYQLAKEYTTDSQQLLLVVNSVRDSLLAASMDTNYSYYGEQRIPLAPKSISVNYTDEYKTTRGYPAE